MALRIILVLAVVMFSFTRQRLAADQVDVSDLRKLWYAQPAEQWSEALPIGNGRLGAMVYGGIAKEHLQLNEDTLWSGGPHDYANPEALSHLADVRTLLKKGRYADAEALAQEMMGQPIYQAAYQPLGDLFLEFPQHQNVSDYRRELDLENAVTTVKYRVGDALFTRRVFASFPDQVIVIRLECDQPGQLTFDVSMTSEHPAQSQTMQGDTLELTGQVAPRGVDPKLTGSRALIAPWDQPGMKFAAQVKIKSQGGTVTAADEKVSVEGADAVTLYYSAATNFVNFQDTSGNPSETVARTLDGIQADSFAEIYRRHVEDYDALFSRVSINLGGENSQSLPTDQRVEQGNQGNADLLLIEQVFQYGRYLMIAGSRQGSQPLNLQGIWNKDLNPRWGSKYTININIEMNYWVAEVCNLSECHEPLLRMVGELQAPGVRAAKTHYKSGGWMTHHNTDLWRGTAPVDGAKWGMWPMGGAWLCQHLWEHYLYTDDEKHLKQSYPIIKGAVEFYLDALVENEDGHLITSPSLSPEHSHGGETKDGKSVGRSGTSLCAGPTIDLQILRDLFTNCIQASEILNVDDQFRTKVVDARSRLAPMKIGKFGQLQEWLVDWDNPDDHHSHVSHMYGLFPSSQINRKDTLKLFEAARTSLTHRGFSGGWSGAWRIALWARLGDSQRALRALTDYVIPRFGKNFFNGGDEFQIDANFGATAGIAEMLMQSHRGEINLLPALPKQWSDGSVTGLRARGGFEVDISWSDGKLAQAKVRSANGSVVNVRYGDELRKVMVAQGEGFTWFVE